MSFSLWYTHSQSYVNVLQDILPALLRMRGSSHNVAVSNWWQESGELTAHKLLWGSWIYFIPPAQGTWNKITLVSTQWTTIYSKEIFLLSVVVNWNVSLGCILGSTTRPYLFLPPGFSCVGTMSSVVHWICWALVCSLKNQFIWLWKDKCLQCTLVSYTEIKVDSLCRGSQGRKTAQLSKSWWWLEHKYMYQLFVPC